MAHLFVPVDRHDVKGVLIGEDRWLVHSKQALGRRANHSEAQLERGHLIAHEQAVDRQGASTVRKIHEGAVRVASHSDDQLKQRNAGARHPLVIRSSATNHTLITYSSYAHLSLIARSSPTHHALITSSSLTDHSLITDHALIIRSSPSLITAHSLRAHHSLIKPHRTHSPLLWHEHSSRTPPNHSLPFIKSREAATATSLSKKSNDSEEGTC